jgi:hypothetical protein
MAVVADFIPRPLFTLLPMLPPGATSNDPESDNPWKYLQHIDSAQSSPMESLNDDDHDHSGILSEQNESRAASIDSATGNTKPSTTKNSKGKAQSTAPTSNQMRRDQNRIAQREFRMRKQQHVSAACCLRWPLRHDLTTLSFASSADQRSRSTR